MYMLRPQNADERNQGYKDKLFTDNKYRKRAKLPSNYLYIQWNPSQNWEVLYI